jgi:hypothetical protein
MPALPPPKVAVRPDAARAMPGLLRPTVADRPHYQAIHARKRVHPLPF